MTIEEQEVRAAQAAWAHGVVEVGAAPSWEASRERAEHLVRGLYRIEDGSLLFGPTKARETQFRHTLKDAVSYFVGRDADHPEDGGFALEPWTAVRFDNAGIVIRGEVALAMGNYHFVRADGSELTAEFSFAYVRGDDGELRIQLHHSALPYAG
jgi:hypothetical protein